MFDLAIKSKNVVTPGGVKEACVIIKGGLIIDVVTHEMKEDDRLLDAGDKVVMAGVIDPHVHINEPGRTNWEGFDTATKAALAGGLTTLVEMPLNASPVTTTVKAFELKLKATENQLHTNCGFWGGIIPGNENEVEPLIDKGVLGFKAFLTHSGIDEFPNVSQEDLRKVMPLIAKHNLPLLVHCELTDEYAPAMTNPRSYEQYLHSRPQQWEDEAIALMIRLCREYNCRVHIVHLSSAGSISQVINAKKEGLPLTVETAQHYLYFNAEKIKEGQTQFKCAPPIRGKENNNQLWTALKNGVIDFVATDHSPATPDLKEMESGNFLTAWGGIASLQFALPALWTAAKERQCGLTDIAKWLCGNPARLVGKEKSKGQIQKGYDADLVIWDQNNSFTVTTDIIRHKHPVTPYLGENLSGVIEQTYLAGLNVFNEGIITSLNKGKIITPTQ